MAIDYYVFDTRSNSLNDLSVISQCYDRFYIIVSDTSSLDEIREALNNVNISFIVSCLRFESIIFLLALFDINRAIFNVNENGDFQLVFDFDNQSEIKWLNDELNIIDYIDNFSNNINAIKASGIPSEIYNLLVANFNSLENISLLDCKMMFKGSFLRTEDILSRKSDTCFDNLLLKEFDAGELEYANVLDSNISLSNSFRRKKLDLFLRVTAIKPSNSSNIEKVDGYPNIYKFYSAYMFHCAKLKRSIGSFSSAFMYYFRALEIYCDGFLILSEVAEINDLYNRQGVLKRSDAFLVNGTFKSGFGGKWGELLKIDEVIRVPNATTDYLSDLILLRNNFVMTHGDVKVNESILTSVEDNISTFINQLESNSNQTQTIWSDLIQYFIDFCSFTTSEEIKNIVSDNNLLRIYTN